MAGKNAYLFVLRPIAIGFCILMSLIELQAQQLDTSYLAPVEILSSLSLDEQQREEIDSLYIQLHQGDNLAQLLGSFSPLFVNAQGPSLLSTGSLNGMGSNHTTIMWGNMRLQSPMNGVVDLALIPMALFDEVSVNQQGGGRQYGSGAAGGAIILDHQASSQDGLTAKFGYNLGSFGKHAGDLGFAYKHKRWSSQLQGYYQQAQNDYPIERGPGAARSEIAAYQQYGLMSRHQYTGDKDLIRFNVWYQDAEREVNKEATQQDGFLRMTASWLHRANKFSYRIDQNIADETLLYQNTLWGLDSHSRFINSFSRAELSFQPIPQHRFLASLQADYTKAFADNYADTPQRLNSTLLLNWQYQSVNQKLLTDLSLRQDYTPLTTQPLIPTFEASYQLQPQLLLSGGVGRQFRLPTFNDLYWQPNGNTELLPEDGLNSHLSFKHNRSLQNWQIESQLRVYSNWMQNMILWRPGPTIWSPSNFREIWSRGFSPTISLSRKWNQSQIQGQFGYSFSRSTNQKGAWPGDASLHKQLIYQPLHSGNASISWIYRGFHLSYNLNLIGKRFTTSDNSDNLLPAFHTDDIHLLKPISIRQHRLNLSGSIRNLFNQPYQVSPNRPMPLRHFQLGLRFEFR